MVDSVTKSESEPLSIRGYPDQKTETTGVAIGVSCKVSSCVRRTEKKFQLALEAAPNGMLLMDAGRCIVLVNAQIDRAAAAKSEVRIEHEQHHSAHRG
jgi:hypothetical protein